MGGRKITAIDLLGRASRVGLAFALVLPATAFAQDAESSPDEILVIGQRPGAGLRADSELDENGIASYGVDTVGDLLDAVASQTDPSGAGPVILINGQPTNGIDDVADLPTEAVSRIQLLSRGAAATLGERPTRRVINVVIRPDHRQLTLNAKGRVATAGQGGQGEGEINLLRLDKGNRNSLVARVSATDRLDEADRDIVSAPGEIAANRFKSLVPGALSTSLNGNVTRKFGPSSIALTVRADRQENRSRIGAIDAFLPRPLGQRGVSTGLTAAAIASGPLGKWRYAVNGNLNWRLARTASDRSSPDIDDLTVRDTARTRSLNSGASASLTGSPFTLPAGPAQASLRTEWRGNRARSTNDGITSFARRLNRDELVGQATLQLPLIRTSPWGSFGTELSGALRHVTASGRLTDKGYALNWQPAERLSIRAAVNHEQIAPPPGALTDPLVTIDNVRVFDFIRQETVLVRSLTGGNPEIGVERRRTINIGGSWRPFDSVNLDLTADYVNRVGRGAFAALPPVNSDVQAAFPDRFVRDGDGRLIAVDARPVPFARVRREDLRTGMTFTRSFGHQGAAATNPREADLAAGWRVNAFLAHEWTLRSDRKARSGLPTVDLLDGGALGYGGGQPRHRIEFGAGAVHRGIGLQLNGDYESGSRIAAGTLADPDQLRFGSRLLINARLFANLGPLLPTRPWAKGARVSLEVANAFDSKQSVRDSDGVTPLGYQRYLLDPLGRTVTVSLRKVF